MLSNTADALERYGGHPMAVGVGLLTSRINEFHEALEKEVRKNITPEDLAEFISYDGETELEYLNSEMFEYMKMLAPFGHGNPKPVFRFNQLNVCKCYLIVNATPEALWLTQKAPKWSSSRLISSRNSSSDAEWTSSLLRNSIIITTLNVLSSISYPPGTFELIR